MLGSTSPARHLIVALVAAVAGCGSPDASTTPADMAQVVGGPKVEGRIIGLDYMGLAGIQVSLCTQTCSDTTTDAQGGFLFTGVATELYTLRALNPASSEYAQLDFPVDFSRGVRPRLPPLVLPRVGAGQTVASGKQNFAVDSMLTLSIDRGKLTGPAGGPVNRLGGVRVPLDL